MARVEYSFPPLPQNAFYPALHPLNYPPKPRLEACKVVIEDGKHGVYLNWTITRRPTRDIAWFEVRLYEHSGGRHSPLKWRIYQGDILRLHMSGLLFPSSQFKPNRRYFFTVRFLDAFDKFGHFGDPVCIEF